MSDATCPKCEHESHKGECSIAILRSGSHTDACGCRYEAAPAGPTPSEALPTICGKGIYEGDYNGPLRELCVLPPDHAGYCRLVKIAATPAPRAVTAVREHDWSAHIQSLRWASFVPGTPFGAEFRRHFTEVAEFLESRTAVSEPVTDIESALSSVLDAQKLVISASYGEMIERLGKIAGTLQGFLARRASRTTDTEHTK